MEPKTGRTKKIPVHLRRRVHHRRAPNKPMPVIDLKEFCLTCNQRISSAELQVLRQNQPREEWNHHSDCFKKQARCLRCGQMISPQMRLTLRRERPRAEWDFHPDCWKNLRVDKPMFR